ncbi:MAG: hypothetical protein MI974_12210 [Chitinophagales bacterium]|nr:hypothetical protein [Chitinophagales bacterium]
MFKQVSLIVVSLLLLTNYSGFSQKVKWEKIKTAYTQLPSKPLPPEFTTYSVKVYGGYSDQIAGAGLTKADLAKKIAMDGFKRVDNGHFRVVVQLGYFRTENVKTNTLERVKEDKEGNKTKYYRYTKSFQYYMPISMQITDYKGNVIEERVLSGSSNAQTWTSKEYSKASELNDWYYKNRTTTRNGLIKSHINSVLSNASSSIRTKYDYQHISNHSDWMEEVRKVPEEEAFLKHIDNVRKVFADMKPDESIDQMKEKVKPAIDYWASLLDLYDAGHKKERKVVHACTYNIAVTFFWLDDLDSAYKYATDCINIGWKETRPKTLQREIEAIRKLFAANNITSRHLKRDIENATPPSNAAAMGELAMEDGGAAANAVNKEGYVITSNGDSLAGQFVINTEASEELTFGPNGNISFVYVSDGMEKKNTLNPAETKAFAMDKRYFAIIPFAPGSDPDAEEQACIMECLYDSNPVSVYTYCPYDDQLGEEEVEFAFRKKEGGLVSTKDTQFLLFGKGLAKYFEDCSDLKELAAAGEFKHNKKDIIRAARVYAELCQE